MIIEQDGLESKKWAWLMNREALESVSADNNSKRAGGLKPGMSLKRWKVASYKSSMVVMRGVNRVGHTNGHTISRSTNSTTSTDEIGTSKDMFTDHTQQLSSAAETMEATETSTPVSPVTEPTVIVHKKWPKEV